MRRVRHVIWDFNGTLLDDVDCCVATLNQLLSERDLPPLSRDHYLEHFGFPVQDFYVHLGFDFDAEPFEDVSRSYIAGYVERLGAARVHRGAREALGGVAGRGVSQSVLSAMEASLLSELLGSFDLTAELSHVRGLDHLNATSKVEVGRRLLEDVGEHPEEVLLVGDTLHDLEVAEALGCRCLLFAGGHQSPPRLRAAGATIIDALSRVVEHVEGPARG